MAPTPRLRVVYLDHCARLSGAELALARLLPVLAQQLDPVVLLGEDGPLVEHLRADGIDVRVLAMDPSTREVRKDTVEPGGVGLVPLLHLGGYLVRLVRELRRLQPDLIHTNSLKAALYGGLAGRLIGIPVVWHVRDRIADDYLPLSAVKLVRLLSRVLPTTVVANSESTLSTLEGLPKRVSGAVVRNPVVRDSVVGPVERERLDDGVFRVGVVGRLSPWKGQHVFLDAFAAALRDTGAEARLIGSAMFGEDAYEQALRDQVQRLGLADRVEFRGFREDVFGELAQLDVLVHCSISAEPFGQVILEGMAAGLPVIASAAGGPLEIITDGVDGLLVRPDDVDALATSLRQVHQDAALRARLGAAAQGTAAKYSPAASVASMMQAYETTLASLRGRARRGRGAPRLAG